VSLLVVVLAGLLACARLTRLITTDQITQPLRAAVVRRAGPASPWAYLIHCRWCTSMWVAPPVAAVVTWYTLGGSLWQQVAWFGLLWFAYSYGTGLLAGAEGNE
jgi:hypothetical protein